MSAKDPRRSVLVRVPDTLRGFLRAERRRGRSASASAALRRIIEHQLPLEFVDYGVALPQPAGPAGASPPYRLQLGRASRARVRALARECRQSDAYVLIQLVAAAAKMDHSVTAPGRSRHRPDQNGRKLEGSSC